MKHNLQHNALGEIEYGHERWTFTFYYEHGSDLVVKDVVKFQPQKTGCYVLFTQDGTIFVVPRGFKYYTEREQKEARKLHGNC